MRHVSRMGVLLPALLLIATSGCATKGWVVEEVGRQQAEMGRQQAEMSNQQAEMGQRIDQVGSETQRVNKRVDTVEGRARPKGREHGRSTRRSRVVGNVGQRSGQRCTRARRRRDDQG